MNIFISLPQRFLLLNLFAALSLFLSLNLYYVGEEAIFPITSMEMQQNGIWLIQHLYGLDVRHNPLFNWLIISCANLFGWSHVEMVARFITICATCTSAALLGWLCFRLFRDIGFAAFAALVYLTLEDVLMYHGWLAYVDPLFAVFIFGAIATLWVACVEQRKGLLFVAALSISCAFLSKAFTAYVFYSVALLVLAMHRPYRKMLLSPPSLLAHGVILFIPLYWFSILPAGGEQSNRMMSEIANKLSFIDASDYALRVVAYPLEVWTGLLPCGALLIYFFLRGRIKETETHPQHFRTALLIAGINFLPYWLSPHGGMRYLIPIYPLIALLMARLLWRSGDISIRTTTRWIAASILLNFSVLLIFFPYYQHHYRGANYAETANEIVSLSHGQPIYTTNFTASGLNVTAYINQLRYPAPTIKWSPQSFNSGFVIAQTPDEKIGAVYKKYQLLGDELFLLCRGSACDQTKPLE